MYNEMSITKLKLQLKNIEEKRRKILKAITNDTPLIVGSITQTKGKCGKINCACSKKATHEITLLMTKENGKKRTQLVRKNDKKNVISLWKRYKFLKQILENLKIYNKEEIELLNQIIYCRKKNYE